jgi:hypothetical protein
MKTEEIAINLLADHICDNCEFFIESENRYEDLVPKGRWCNSERFEKCAEEGTCSKWITKKLEAPWVFSIPKNLCGEIEISEHNVCTLKEIEFCQVIF